MGGGGRVSPKLKLANQNYFPGAGAVRIDGLELIMLTNGCVCYTRGQAVTKYNQNRQEALTQDRTGRSTMEDMMMFVLRCRR